MDIDLFTPTNATATVNVAATTTSARVALPSIGRTNGVARIVNDGLVTAFVVFGDSSVNAVATTSIPVPAGAITGFAINDRQTHMAAITASGTATVYVTVGQGC